MNLFDLFLKLCQDLFSFLIFDHLHVQDFFLASNLINLEGPYVS